MDTKRQIATWAISTILAVLISVSGSCFATGGRIGGTESRLDEGLKQINQRFTDLGRQVDRIENANDSLDGYLRRLEVSVAVLERDVKRLDAGTTALGGLEGTLVALQTEHKGLQGSVEGLRVTPGSLSEDLRSQLRRIEERLNEVAGKVGVPLKGAS